MSAFVGSYRDEMDACYAADFGRDREPMKKQSRRPEYRRTGGSPTRVNGMHCRRGKRWTWGSGRGARIQNLRAFASMVLVSAATLFTSAATQGAPISIPTVAVSGSNATNAGNGYGAVSYDFRIGQGEVTNAQYAAFLTATGTSRGTYDSRMQITGSAGVFTANPGSTNNPVTFVSWFSAARFVNWLVTGTSTETGAYALNGTNAYVPRTPGAQFFIPNASEWTKAAYFNGSSAYFNFGTTNNSAPANVAPASAVGNPNAANFASAVGATTASGAYGSTVSPYAAYDMMGNVTEWTETVLSGSGATATLARMGGNFSTSLGNLNTQFQSGSTLSGAVLTSASGNVGFRIGEVAAVPEPGTIALAATGLFGVAGAGWLKRRKRQASSLAPAAALAG